MAFVVTEPCIKCKFTDCVSVCPVDCFKEGENMLAIDPVECIDCGACVPECPVNAIYLDSEVPEAWSEYTALNARLALGWPAITKQKGAPPGADAMKIVANKRAFLSEKPGG